VTLRSATVNGLPGLLVEGADGLIQTVAFEIADDVIKAIYVVRNPDKLRHLSSPGSSPL
jgi:RNA polymerase sigma-70 factor (ECF subfamily)